MYRYLFLCFVICASGFISKAQSRLMFGTIKMEGRTIQGRFEVYSDSVIRSIIYAPYGITPVAFTDLIQTGNHLQFSWQVNHTDYKCFLLTDSLQYQGECKCKSGKLIQITIREFNEADAILQGDSLHASQKDIQIIDRALSLLNNGSNWNRQDNRVCDNCSTPNKWSLFCALHQASIDVDGEYRHLRPAIQATRQAIGEVTYGKQYAHLLQDFNNEVEDYTSILEVLNRGKIIISEKIKNHQ